MKKVDDMTLLVLAVDADVGHGVLAEAQHRALDLVHGLPHKLFLRIFLYVWLFAELDLGVGPGPSLSRV